MPEMFATSFASSTSQLDQGFFYFLAKDTCMKVFRCDLNPLGTSLSVSLSSFALSSSHDTETFESLRFLQA
jgi:hypothetical protein